MVGMIYSNIEVGGGIIIFHTLPFALFALFDTSCFAGQLCALDCMLVLDVNCIMFWFPIDQDKL